MPNTIVLVANAPFSPDAEALLRTSLAVASTVIGVDGGARTLTSLNVVPDIVTGDFDSLSVDERAHLQSAGATLVPTPDQNYTDLDKALGIARERFLPGEILVFGATGGRLDHTYSALSALIKHGRQTSIHLIDETAAYFLIDGVVQLSSDDLTGRTLSLLAMGRVDGVTATGVEWPLDNESLSPGVRDGTLNRIIAPNVTLSVAHGDLIAMLHHAPSLSWALPVRSSM